MNRPMNPNTKAGAVLRILREGPATTGEVAASTGLPFRLASAHLSNLRRRKKVVSEPFGTLKVKKLWKIVEAV